MPGYDYSFSGIKTAVLYFLRDRLKEDPYFIEKHLNDISASVQHTLVEMLMDKLVRCAKDYGIREVAIAEGVAANSLIRRKMDELSGQYQWNTYIPRLEYCTDNAAMIGISGYFRFLKGEFSDLRVGPDPRLKF
jgi:N6-L-threonylcarbamoyladenine synthase